MEQTSLATSMFFFLWLNYYNADAEHFYVISQIQFKRIRANTTHMSIPHIYCKTLQLKSCLYQLHLVFSFKL